MGEHGIRLCNYGDLKTLLHRAMLNGCDATADAVMREIARRHRQKVVPIRKEVIPMPLGC